MRYVGRSICARAHIANMCLRSFSASTALKAFVNHCNNVFKWYLMTTRSNEVPTASSTAVFFRV